MQSVSQRLLFDQVFRFFYKTLGDVSNEHGKPLYQNISAIESRYRGKWSVCMLAD